MKDARHTDPSSPAAELERYLREVGKKRPPQVKMLMARLRGLRAAAKAEPNKAKRDIINDNILKVRDELRSYKDFPSARTHKGSGSGTLGSSLSGEKTSKIGWAKPVRG
jgi:hypothetical protein